MRFSLIIPAIALVVGCVHQHDTKSPAEYGDRSVQLPACRIDLSDIKFKHGRPTASETLAESINLPIEASRQILAEAADTLRRNPEVRVAVNGFADQVEGNLSERHSLSERRAKLVYEYLISEGVPESQLVRIDYFGSTKPIAPPDAEDPAKYNRRVEFEIQN